MAFSRDEYCDCCTFTKWKKDGAAKYLGDGSSTIQKSFEGVRTKSSCTELHKDFKLGQLGSKTIQNSMKKIMK